MPPSLITPPEDVERAMEALFHSIESRDPSMKRFKDADFDKISQLLLQLGKKGWAERPRTYAILRVIGSVSVMDSFINAGLLDIAIPYTQARMAAVLPRDIAISFTEKQSMVMTETYEIEKAGGRHQHLDHDGDAHFSVVRVLGSGGYGEVDHVRSKLSLQDYARKRIRRSKIQSVDQEALQSFMRELTSLKRLKHHHLVTLLGSYTDPKYVGLIMREVADCNLKEYLERTPFPSTEKQCLRGFYGSLASAVAYLHRNRVRHKDLKPQNILVKDQKILITDFGAALDWSDSEKSTTKGRRGQHTPAYMAPEVEDYQARNSSTDIYSLGLIFMDIITVLKGETLDSRVGYFKKNGSRTPFHRTNSVASKSWAQFLEKKTNEDNQPLKWIREMTQERPQDRIKADVLLKKVLAYKDDYCYYSICCEEDETVDENVFDFGIEADHHHVMQVNPDFAQTDPFAESQAQQDQNSQSLTAVGSSRDQGEGKRFIDAAKDGNLLMVKLLIQNGTDIESKDENGQTALMFAAQQGHLTLLKYLLDAGADIECQGNDGWKPLHTAAYNGQLQEVKELIERQALIEAQTNDGQCPLHLACRRGHQETVMLLLERGADIDRETYKGWTALHFAAKHGHESVARLLLTAPQELPGQVLEGANIEATVDKGCNCLHIAADNGEPMLVELFLEMGIDIETRTELEWTPFHFAARSNEKGVALVLLSHGANMQAIAHDGSMPLHMAARNGSDDMAALLIEMGVNIEAVTIDQMMTPLHCAASNGHVETLRLLLQEGAKLTARTIVNYTALHLCCEGNVGSETGRLACARLLLELGIDVHATENGNLTPLHLAAFYGQDSIVEILLEYGGDIHAEDDDTDTPLDCAIRKSHERIARLLIERGADIMRKDGRAMRFAVKAGHEGIVRLLVRNGADTEGYEELLQVLDLNDDRSRDEDGAAKPSSEDLAAIAKMLEEDEKNPGACNQTPSRSQTTIRRPNCGQSQDVELNRVIEQSRVLAQIREQEQIRELEQRSEIEHKRELEKRREDEKKQEDEERRELEQASQKDSDAIQRLCDYGFDIALAIEAYSISRKNEEEAKIMLLELYEDFVESDITRYDPGSLRKSVEKGDMAELKILLAMGCNINEVSKTDQTALMCAAAKGQESFVQILLEYGADVSIQNSAGLTALHFATEAGNKAAAKLLLENGADIGARSKKGWTPLGFASPSIRPFLEEWSAPPKSVDMEADSNFEEEFQEPAPLKSFPTGSTESTNSSQSNTIRKAPPPVPTKNPELAKRYGKRPGSTTMSDISAASFTGISSITGNASVASPENTVDLIENSIDPNMTIRIHRLPSSESRATATIRPKLAFSSPSTQSSESKSKGPIRPQLDSSSPRNSLLYSRPAAAIQPQATSSSRSIPMITSSTSNVPTIASSISSIPTMASSPPSTPSLESRSISPQQPKASLASPEPRSIAHPQPSSSPSSSTIPPIASTRNTPSPAPERLQPSPALPYPPTVTTPAQTLHQAVSRGTALELIALLKKSHTHPSSPIDSQLNTPLHLACADDSDLKVRLLLKYGADVNAANSLGNTPLHKAAQHGHAAIVKLLFGSNASVNAKNNDGSTPLHLAAFYGNIKVVRLLCDCGGETGLKDRDGLDVLGAAKQGERLQAGNQREHDETLRFLKLRI